MAKPATKPPSRADRLAALKDKLKHTDLGASGAGFWSPIVGDNTIRILPEVGEMQFFFQTVGRHYFPDKRNIYCPKFTSESQLECPVCEIVSELYKSGDKSSKKLASEIGLRRGYWMNVINRQDPAAGPLIYTPGVQVFNAIVAIISDPDYGDIFDIDDGLDLVIQRTGKGLNTEYQVLAKRKSTPLSDDPEQIEEWLEKAKDLSWVEVDEDPDNDKELSEGHAVYLLPYNRIVTEFGLDDFDVDAALDALEAAEENEEPAPAKKTTAKPSGRMEAKPPKRKPVVEDDDDEEPVDDDEDDDTAPPAKKEVERRLARRSTRR